MSSEIINQKARPEARVGIASVAGYLTSRRTIPATDNQ